MAGKDVLDLPSAERPHCVYEQDEYDATITALDEVLGTTTAEAHAGDRPAPSFLP
jgi:hypothetical protein